jgi:hypothetical protein
MTNLKLLTRHSRGGTGETMENLSHDNRSWGQDLNPAHPEDKARVLTTRPRRSNFNARGMR